VAGDGRGTGAGGVFFWVALDSPQEAICCSLIVALASLADALSLSCFAMALLLLLLLLLMLLYCYPLFFRGCYLLVALCRAVSLVFDSDDGGD